MQFPFEPDARVQHLAQVRHGLALGTEKLFQVSNPIVAVASVPRTVCNRAKGGGWISRESITIGSVSARSHDPVSVITSSNYNSSFILSNSVAHRSPRDN
jgi:hypothetical protein